MSITFFDDYTQHTWACLIKKKCEDFSCFLEVKSLVERETRMKIKCKRSNGRKEYFSGQLSSYLQKEGIRREFSCRYIYCSRTVWLSGTIGQQRKRHAKCLRRSICQCSTRAKRSKQSYTFKIEYLHLEEKCCPNIRSDTELRWTSGIEVKSHPRGPLNRQTRSCVDPPFRRTL